MATAAGTDLRTDLFINNAWRPAGSGERFEVTNPATEDVIAEVAAQVLRSAQVYPPTTQEL